MGTSYRPKCTNGNVNSGLESIHVFYMVWQGASELLQRKDTRNSRGRCATTSATVPVRVRPRAAKLKTDLRHGSHFEDEQASSPRARAQIFDVLFGKRPLRVSHRSCQLRLFVVTSANGVFLPAALVLLGPFPVQTRLIRGSPGGGMHD